MAANNKLKVNWYGVTMASTTLTLVTSVAVDNRGNIISFSGDIDRFMTTKVNDMNDPMVTITTGDINGVRTLTPGTRGTFAATLKAASNQAAAVATGDVVFAGTAGIVANNPVDGSHKQFASGKVMIEFESADGLTNPLASTVTA